MTTRRISSDPEVPEADALEQSMPVAGDGRPDDGTSTFDQEDALVPPMSELAADVPEADALEQAQPAGDDRDDGWYDARS
jgi:hypothetical protein